MYPPIYKLQEQLELCYSLLQSISSKHYTFSIPELGGASIGQHMRHTIEIIQALEKGGHTGTLDYDRRERNPKIEQNATFAGELCRNLQQTIIRTDKQLSLNADSEEAVNTTFYREVIYVLDHTIHHLALIKTGLRILQCDSTSDNFGMAYSTIRYKQQQTCAQ